MHSTGVLTLCPLLIYGAHLIYRVYSDEPQSFKFGRGVLIFVAFAYYLWLCASFFANRWKELRLLTDGFFARGIVLVQNGVGRFPHVIYVFRDSLGRQFQKRVTDFSGGLFEQMPVSIFYDDREPTRSMALESSLFRLLD